jgi:hypothetical protein
VADTAMEVEPTTCEQVQVSDDGKCYHQFFKYHSAVLFFGLRITKFGIGTKISIKVVESDAPEVSKPRVAKNKNAEMKEPKSTTNTKKPTIQVINSHNLKRNDVVIKSILRAMKRYFKTKYIELTDFKKTSGAPTPDFEVGQVSNKKASNYVDLLNLDPRNELMLEYTQAVLADLKLGQGLENMGFYLLALTFPNETMKMLTDLKAKAKMSSVIIKKALDTLKLIDAALNRFSKKVFKNFMEMAEISYMVQHFLINNAEHLDRIEGFDTCVNLIGDKANQVIAKFEEASD